MDVRYDKPNYAFDSADMTLTWDIEDDEGYSEPVTVPAKYEVCHVCNGKGTHVNPNVDSDGITPEDFAEDPDFMESYFSGAYDISCNWCGGGRVEPVMDEGRTTVEAVKKVNDWLDALAEYARIMAHERGMEY